MPSVAGMGRRPLKAEVRVKRVYEAASPEDGRRVLVDRLWPRGLTREKAAIDEWAKELAPSDRLRRWFGHDPKRWVEFWKRYREELLQQTDRLADLVRPATRETLTLVYGAKDPERNNAVVLKALLDEVGKGGRRG